MLPIILLCAVLASFPLSPRSWSVRAANVQIQFSEGTYEPAHGLKKWWQHPTGTFPFLFHAMFPRYKPVPMGRDSWGTGTVSVEEDGSMRLSGGVRIVPGGRLVRKFWIRILLFAATVLIAYTTGILLFGVTKTWNGTQANANNALAWTPNGIPGAGDACVFDSTSSNDCDWDLAATVTSVGIAGGGTVYNGTVTLSAAMNTSGFINQGISGIGSQPANGFDFNGQNVSAGSNLTIFGGTLVGGAGTVSAASAITIGGTGSPTVTFSGSWDCASWTQVNGTVTPAATTTPITCSGSWSVTGGTWTDQRGALTIDASGNLEHDRGSIQALYTITQSGAITTTLVGDVHIDEQFIASATGTISTSGGDRLIEIGTSGTSPPFDHNGVTINSGVIVQMSIFNTISIDGGTYHDLIIRAGTNNFTATLLSALTCTGDLDIRALTASQTFTFNASTFAIDVTGSTFVGASEGQASTTANLDLGSAATQILGAITLGATAAGTLDATGTTTLDTDGVTFASNGTLNASGSSVAIEINAGDFDMDAGGTYTVGNSTLVLNNAGAQAIVPAITLYSIAFNETGSLERATASPGSISVTNTFAVVSGKTASINVSPSAFYINGGTAHAAFDNQGTVDGTSGVSFIYFSGSGTSVVDNLGTMVNGVGFRTGSGVSGNVIYRLGEDWTSAAGNNLNDISVIAGHAIFTCTLDTDSANDYDIECVDFTLNSNVREIFTPNDSTVTLTGSWDSADGTFTASGSTIILAGTSQTLAWAAAGLFNALTVSGTYTSTLGAETIVTTSNAGIIISGTWTMDGSSHSFANNGATNINTTGGTINGTAQITFRSSSAGYTLNANTFAGTVSNAVRIRGIGSTGSPKFTLAGALTTTGSLSVNYGGSGTSIEFDTAGFAVNCNNLNMTTASTILTAGASTITASGTTIDLSLGTFNEGTSNLVMTGAAALTVGTNSKLFYSLTINNSNTVTMAGSFNVSCLTGGTVTIGTDSELIVNALRLQLNDSQIANWTSTGTISGTGDFYLVADTADRLWDNIGTVEVDTFIRLSAAAAADRTVTLGAALTVTGSLTVDSDHVSNTITLDTDLLDLDVSSTTAIAADGLIQTNTNAGTHSWTFGGTVTVSGTMTATVGMGLGTFDINMSVGAAINGSGAGAINLDGDATNGDVRVLWAGTGTSNDFSTGFSSTAVFTFDRVTVNNCDGVELASGGEWIFQRVSVTTNQATPAFRVIDGGTITTFDTCSGTSSGAGGIGFLSSSNADILGVMTDCTFDGGSSTNDVSVSGSGVHEFINCTFTNLYVNMGSATGGVILDGDVAGAPNDNAHVWGVTAFTDFTTGPAGLDLFVVHADDGVGGNDAEYTADDGMGVTLWTGEAGTLTTVANESVVIAGTGSTLAETIINGASGNVLFSASGGTLDIIDNVTANGGAFQINVACTVDMLDDTELIADNGGFIDLDGPSESSRIEFVRTSVPGTEPKITITDGDLTLGSVLLRNVTITDYSVGVDLSGTGIVQMENVRLVDCAQGINIEPAAASDSYADVQNCHFIDCTTGLRVEAEDVDNRFVKCRMRGCGVGLEVQGAQVFQGSIIDVACIDSTSYGLQWSGPTPGTSHVVRDCVFHGDTNDINIINAPVIKLNNCILSSKVITSQVSPGATGWNVISFNHGRVNTKEVRVFNSLSIDSSFFSAILSDSYFWSGLDVKFDGTEYLVPTPATTPISAPIAASPNTSYTVTVTGTLGTGGFRVIETLIDTTTVNHPLSAGGGSFTTDLTDTDFLQVEFNNASAAETLLAIEIKETVSDDVVFNDDLINKYLWPSADWSYASTFRVEQTSSTDVLPFGEPGYESLDIEIDLQTISAGRAGVIFGYQDSQNYYEAYLDSTNTLTVRKIVAGVPFGIDTATTFDGSVPISATTTAYRMRVLRGLVAATAISTPVETFRTIQVYLNDVLVDVDGWILESTNDYLTDTAFATGKLGLISESGNELDNLSVSHLGFYIRDANLNLAPSITIQVLSGGIFDLRDVVVNATRGILQEFAGSTVIEQNVSWLEGDTFDPQIDGAVTYTCVNLVVPAGEDIILGPGGVLSLDGAIIQSADPSGQTYYRIITDFSTAIPPIIAGKVILQNCITRLKPLDSSEPPYELTPPELADYSVARPIVEMVDEGEFDEHPVNPISQEAYGRDSNFNVIKSHGDHTVRVNFRTEYSLCLYAFLQRMMDNETSLEVITPRAILSPVKVVDLIGIPQDNANMDDIVFTATFQEFS